MANTFFLVLFLILSNPVSGHKKWLKDDRLTTTAGTGYEFGYDSDIDGDVIVGGIPNYLQGDVQCGGAAVFAQGKSIVKFFTSLFNTCITYNQISLVTPSDCTAGQKYGFSVAVSGDLAIIGAPGDNGKKGAAYIVIRDAVKRTWSQVTKLVPSDGVANDQFGYYVDISSNTVAIGAPRHAGKGAVYVYTKTGATWSNEKKLTYASSASNDQFGFSLAINPAGTSIAIGASNVALGAGAVYVFNKDSGGNWVSSAPLTGQNTGDQFGMSVDISDQRIIVGAGLNGELGTSAGAAYVYVGSGSSWNLEQKILLDGGAAGDVFGQAVALDKQNNLLAVGAYADDTRFADSGGVYVYELTDGKWTQAADFGGGDAGNFYGYSVSMYNAKVAGGAWGASTRDNAQAGEVLVHSYRCRVINIFCLLFAKK